MNGILLIDKPSGWTSNDVVCKLKGVLHERRIGHSGTLDPLATGLLPVFIGKATKAVEFAESMTKKYAAELTLGIKTDTQDITGRVVERSDNLPDFNTVEKCCISFIGEIEQIPPMYSAIKINGTRLYDIARTGQTVERKARKITIFDISVNRLNGSDSTYELLVECSKGTYIRTLCNDIGEKVGCFGCMSQLRRLKCGIFDIKDAVSLSDIIRMSEIGEDISDCLLPIDCIFCDRPKLSLNYTQEKQLRCGKTISVKDSDGVYRVYSENTDFLSLCRVSNGIITSIKNFF